jgi:hypothetical protein
VRLAEGVFKVSGVLDVKDPLGVWLRSALSLAELEIVRRAYAESYKLLPSDVRDALKWYLGDSYLSLDLLLCMYPYRNLQYGPKGKVELRRRMKLGWIAHNMYAAQRLLNQWSQVEQELRKQSLSVDFIRFLHNYLQTTIAELAVLYVYLYNGRAIMPLGFMQHVVTLGPSGPALGDFIDIETLTFIEVKSRRDNYKPDLLSLAINTRLPSAVAIPRYKVDKEKRSIDKSTIVVDLYTLAVAGRKRPWITRKDEYLKAPIEDELKPLMQNIPILEENARDYLQESQRTVNKAKPGTSQYTTR